MHKVSWGKWECTFHSLDRTDHIKVIHETQTQATVLIRWFRDPRSDGSLRPMENLEFRFDLDTNAGELSLTMIYAGGETECANS